MRAIGSSSVTFDPDAWKRLLEANHRWWRTPGAVEADNPFSAYDCEAILAENGYAPAILEALNSQVITTESQRGRRETVAMAEVPSMDYVRSFEKDGHVPRGAVRRLTQAGLCNAASPARA